MESTPKKDSIDEQSSPFVEKKTHHKLSDEYVCVRKLSDSSYGSPKKKVNKKDSIVSSLGTSYKVPIKFKQPSESSPAKVILMHIPKFETFICSLHPASSLYEDVTSAENVAKCFKKLKEYLKNKGIILLTVEEIIHSIPGQLDELAFNSLQYVEDKNSLSDLDKNDQNYEAKLKEFKYKISDEYKSDVIDKLSNYQKIDIILTRPTYTLKFTNTNTFVEATSMAFNPLGNLIFCRDQQITTQKGVVISRMNSSIRSAETEIMKLVFSNIGADIIGEVTEGFLEGGDFFVAKKNLSMIGVGLRTDMTGAGYLMKEDLLGTEYMAVCYDDNDLDQQRMHLDTYFNIVNDNYCVCIDFEDISKIYKKKLFRKVYLYQKNGKIIKSDNKLIENEFGKYKLIKIYGEFYEFLESQGFKIIKISHQQQVDYMINFLNIGNNTILAVNYELKDVIKETGATVEYFPFKPILNMYGAMHCCTQVSREDD